MYDRLLYLARDIAVRYKIIVALVLFVPPTEADVSGLSVLIVTLERNNATRMECSWCCLFLAAVAVALSTPRPCSANYRVYITATELQSYYQDTEHADAVRGTLKV